MKGCRECHREQATATIKEVVKIKKIGILADTHIPRRAPSLPPPVVQGLQGVDLIIHAGDLVSKRALGELKSLAPLEVVAGNHDHKRFGDSLPKGKIIRIDNLEIGITHGGQDRSDYPVASAKAREFFHELRPGIIIYGHTHLPQLHYDGETVMLNPGSPTDNRQGFPGSFARLLISHHLTVELIFFRKSKKDYVLQTQRITIEHTKLKK